MERGVVDPSPTLASVTELSPKLVESHSQADPSPTLASVIELSPKLVQSQSQATRDVDHEWWRGAVIYQIYVRSFQDHNGDGVGDLIGVIERLEYVASLGVDAIWVSPFFRSPMKDFGYDVASYRQVDPLFGTLDDFDRLLEKAHSFGLKVIIDMVLSHTSDKHEWFVESRASRTNQRADWYVWADAKPDGSPPNNWLSMFGGVAWQWDSSRLQYYLHNFLPCQPDLNFHCPEVQEAVLRECQFWLERGVDGLRLDTVNFYFQSRGLESNPPIKPEQFNDTTAPAVNPYNFQDHVYDKSQPENLEFLKKLRGLLNQYSGRTSLGEIGDSQRQLELSTLYTTGRDRLHMAYTFDFLGGEFDVDYFVKVISQYSSLSSGWMCNSFSNHDVVRHISRWGRNLAPTERNAFSSLCISLLLCLRGSVCIYQGEELGLTEAELSFEELVDPYGIEFWPKYKGRDGCRTPLPWNGGSHLGGFTSNPKSWLPVPSSHLGSAVNIQEADENSILVHYRKMIAFRRGHPVLCFGSIDVHPLSSATCGVLAFWRATSDEKVLCIFNLCSKASNFRLERHYSIIGLDCPGSKDVVIDDERDITLPAFAYFIGLVDI